MTDDAPRLSIVLPARDEANFLEDTVRAVVDGARDFSPFEVYVVENGSEDDTLTLARRLSVEIAPVRTLTLPRPDYGAALRAGLLAARGELVATFDVDYYDLAFLAAAIERLEGSQPPVIVVGSKRARGARDARPWPRRLVTAVFSTILRVGFGLRLSDTHGMKVLQREPVLPLARACRFDRDLFDTELVLRAERAGLGTAEIPVAVEEQRPSRVSIWRRVPRTVVGLVRLRVALWRDRPRRGA